MGSCVKTFEPTFCSTKEQLTHVFLGYTFALSTLLHSTKLSFTIQVSPQILSPPCEHTPVHHSTFHPIIICLCCSDATVLTRDHILWGDRKLFYQTERVSKGTLSWFTSYVCIFLFNWHFWITRMSYQQTTMSHSHKCLSSFTGAFQNRMTKEIPSLGHPSITMIHHPQWKHFHNPTQDSCELQDVLLAYSS